MKRILKGIEVNKIFKVIDSCYTSEHLHTTWLWIIGMNLDQNQTFNALSFLKHIENRERKLKLYETTIL
ncbi:MAG: hypothetical protein K0S44_203 [Bacteroidetes bacterium]|jgi:hypothetical protein|nr:hypothetical protein [Bacteroidota bacterium]